MQRLNGPCFRPSCKLLFGERPGIIKKMGSTVVVEMFFRMPPTVGEEHMWMLLILPKLQVGAAFEMSDQVFSFLKKYFESVYLVLFENHFNNTDDHWKSLRRGALFYQLGHYSKKTFTVW